MRDRRIFGTGRPLGRRGVPVSPKSWSFFIPGMSISESTGRRSENSKSSNSSAGISTTDALPPVFSSMRRKTGVAVIRVACPRDRTRERRALRIGIRTAKKTMNPPKM
jgi:hypothetical protein